MQLNTLIIRHKRENLKKCSLFSLQSRPDFLFLSYPSFQPFDFSKCFLLSMDSEEIPLSKKDSSSILLLLDGTWKLVEKMEKNTKGLLTLQRRSIPSHFLTAYPRRQEDCPDPQRGLASVEALYIAFFLMGRETKGLLDHYHWKEKFLAVNQQFFYKV